MNEERRSHFLRISYVVCCSESSKRKGMWPLELAVKLTDWVVAACLCQLNNKMLQLSSTVALDMFKGISKGMQTYYGNGYGLYVQGKPQWGNCV